MVKNKFLQTLRKRLTFSLIGSIFTAICLVLSMLLSIVTFYVNKEMTDILSSFQTKTINKGFPDNIPEIKKLLDEAKKSIEIYTDFVGYGYYSSPKESAEYIKSLKDLTHKDSSEQYMNTVAVTLSIYAYNDSLYRSVLEKQFKQDSFNTIQESPTFKEYVARLKESDPESCAECTRIGNKEDFIEYLSKEELKKRNNFDFTELDEEIPGFMWVIDGKKAIISFPSYISVAEYSIETQDKSLIDVFRQLFQAKISKKNNGTTNK